MPLIDRRTEEFRALSGPIAFRQTAGTLAEYHQGDRSTSLDQLPHGARSGCARILL